MAGECHHHDDHGHKSHGKKDWLLWGSIVAIVVGYIPQLLHLDLPTYFSTYAISTFDMMNKMWWGLALAILFVGVLDFVPRELVMAVLGSKRGMNGLLRATLAGLLLDLCSHGILVIGMKIYERGASLGQTMAFLIASPWNSFSMTIILVALVGLPKTLIFIGLSCVIALVSGFIFELLVARGVLPDNPNSLDLPSDIKISSELRKVFAQVNYSPRSVKNVLVSGFKSSKMVLRWIFFGVFLASLVRTFVPPEMFQTYFGPSLMGLGLTIVVATVLEVCSEGSAPIAADLVNIAGAPGNGFTFLMTGVSTDYTEIMALKETTGSWKISLFLPLVTVPQVVFLGYLLNVFG